MEYLKVKKLSGKEFRRLTGAKPVIFEEMAAVLRDADDARRLRGGRKSRFCVEDRLLMMLEYWREYRTQFHIAQSRGLSEPYLRDIMRWCEDTLIRSGKFTLPGRKSLQGSDMQHEVIIIDATETPVERPKKNSGGGIRARKSATR
jgi:hypothetical protein